MENQFVKSFFKRILILMAIIAGIVILIDPFFHYHKPWFGLKEVLTDKEYQCIGTLRNFDYDSLIVGSSVAENYNNNWFNDGFDCNAIKAIRSYGATADLCYLLDAAYEEHDLKYVFYSMDASSLAADPVPTYELTGCPMYLYNDNIFDDVKYLYNKGVLLEKIPYMAANSVIGDYDPANSYNWAQWKDFGEDIVLKHYIRTPDIKPMKDKDYYKDLRNANIKLITDQISAHPETEFKIFFPAYSMLWWDNIYRTGDLEAYLYNLEKTVESLLTYDNVKLFYFQNERDIITDLNHYMDTLHFSKDINQYMAEQIVAGNNELTSGNYKEKFKDMNSLAYEIVNELVIPYEDSIQVDYTK